MADRACGPQARFPRDYRDARQRFRDACAACSVPLRSRPNPNRGPDGEGLAADVAWVGPEAARKVLVLVSGTHGAEGFCGSAAQVDWLAGGGPDRLAPDTAVLMIHAINPYGFAWLRRVTEEGVDLNRNFVDFSGPLPENPGYDELADALVPARLSGPAFEAAEIKLADWRAAHGNHAFQLARKAGQYKHPGGVFFGGFGPTWSRATLEAIIADYAMAGRDQVVILDYHTGLGPFGYGEPILKNPPGSAGARRARRWFGESVTEPALGTSTTPPLHGSASNAWLGPLGERAIFIALEFGTFGAESGRTALRDDHWLHALGPVDWDSEECRRIKAGLRRHYFPDTDDWKEMVLLRSRQVLRQALAGLAEA